MATQRIHWSKRPEREEICKRISEKRKAGWPKKLQRYGITEEQYRTNIASGYKWCVGCKQFHPRSEWNRPDEYGPCNEFVRGTSNARYQSLSQEERSEIAAKQYANDTPEGKRRRQLWFYFRITPEEYEKLLSSQNGVCAICGRPAKKLQLVIDHDHACCSGRQSCGKCIRGLLCVPCNRRLPLIEYNQDWPEQAKAYLKRYEDRKCPPPSTMPST